MTDSTIILPETSKEIPNKPVNSDNIDNKSFNNDNIDNKSFNNDNKPLIKLPKPRKIRADKGKKHIFKNKTEPVETAKHSETVSTPPSVQRKIKDSAKGNFVFILVVIALIFGIGIFLLKTRTNSPNSQRDIFA